MAGPAGAVNRRQFLNACAGIAVAGVLSAVLGIPAAAAADGAARPMPNVGPNVLAKVPPKVLVLGDSLTAGFGLPREEAFPARLASALEAAGHPVSLIEASVSGDTSAAARSRLAWSLDALGAAPDAAIVELGANDALRGLSPEQMRANLSAILDEFGKRSIPVLLAGMHAPPNLGESYGREYDAVFADLVRRYDVVFYPFFLEGVALDPALNQPDGIHPNAEGVDVIVKKILPSVEALLTRVAATSGRRAAR